MQNGHNKIIPALLITIVAFSTADVSIAMAGNVGAPKRPIITPIQPPIRIIRPPTNPPPSPEESQPLPTQPSTQDDSVSPPPPLTEPGAPPSKVDSPVISPTIHIPAQPEKSATIQPLIAEMYVPDEVLVAIPYTMGDRLERIGREVDITLLERAHLQAVGLVVGRYRIIGRRGLFETMDDITLTIEDVKEKVFVQTNNYFEVQGVTESPTYNVQAIRAPEAHSLATGRGVRIALLDTPVDTDHPAYYGRVQEDRKIIPNEKPGAHGTALAGIIAGKGDIYGIAPDVTLISIPVCRTEKNRSPRTTSFLLASGLDLALQKKVKGVNLSLGGPKDSLIGLLIDEAMKRKTVIVAAAGNSGPKGQPPYPATHNGVIAVTAIDYHDHLDPRATHGSYVSLSAPGVDIISTAPNGGMQVSTGTSLAAAHVSGVVALILERWPDVTPAFVKRLLESSAHDLGPSGKDSIYGAGRVDALRALEIGLSGKVKD